MEDNEEEQEHQQEDELVYEDEDDTSTVANGSNKPKEPVKMTCSHWHFVNLLIELLSFHAWYKYGSTNMAMLLLDRILQTLFLYEFVETLHHGMGVLV
jgi:hypothetical protein